VVRGPFEGEGDALVRVGVPAGKFDSEVGTGGNSIVAVKGGIDKGISNSKLLSGVGGVTEVIRGCLIASRIFR
jgi:hypothetical protein